MSETDRLNAIRLAAARKGWRLFRNNSGVAKHFAPDGRLLRVVRYGLANESDQLNKQLKSGDLIGFTATGQFVSLEDKPVGGIIDPAQANWRALVNACGGLALIVYGPEDLP